MGRLRNILAMGPVVRTWIFSVESSPLLSSAESGENVPASDDVVKRISYPNKHFAQEGKRIIVALWTLLIVSVFSLAVSGSALILSITYNWPTLFEPACVILVVSALAGLFPLVLLTKRKWAAYQRKWD